MMQKLSQTLCWFIPCVLVEVAFALRLDRGRGCFIVAIPPT